MSNYRISKTIRKQIMDFTKQLDMSRFGTLLERSAMDSKPHQHQGVEWCINRELTPNEYGGVRGGIMADEMGLGKTIQMLGVVLCNFKRRTLIILPKSLMCQWVDTIKSTLGHDPLVFHGSGASSLTEARVAAAPIVVSTYGMLRKDLPLTKISWDRVIFDEAHHLRNNDTDKQKNAIKLKSKIMWFVTGTPIQNRESDLYSLFKVMKIPDHVYTFNARGKDNKKAPNYDIVRKMKHTLIIKRTKKSAKLELPATSNHVIVVDWKSDEERNVAEEIHGILFSELLGRKNRFTPPWERYALPFICFSKQMCTAPKSMARHVGKLTGQESIDGTELRDPNATDGVINTALGNNSKIDRATEEIIARKDNGRLKLVFVEFRLEMETVRQCLVKNGITVGEINGATSASARKAILANIPSIETKYVLLLQIKVGCEGLNLQQFSEVYFLSPNWNPAVEDQAVARCHRIGQKLPVDIFRFSMEGFGRDTQSIDNYITEKQIKKRKVMVNSDQCWEPQTPPHPNTQA